MTDTQNFNTIQEGKRRKSSFGNVTQNLHACMDYTPTTWGKINYNYGNPLTVENVVSSMYKLVCNIFNYNYKRGGIGQDGMRWTGQDRIG